MPAKTGLGAEGECNPHGMTMILTSTQDFLHRAEAISATGSVAPGHALPAHAALRRASGFGFQSAMHCLSAKQTAAPAQSPLRQAAVLIRGLLRENSQAQQGGEKSIMSLPHTTRRAPGAAPSQHAGPDGGLTKLATKGLFWPCTCDSASR